MLRNIGSNIIGTILPSLAALAAVPMLVGKLGMGGFGVFSMQVAALFFFGLSDFGISRAIVLLAFDRGFTGDAGWRRPYAIGMRYSVMISTAVLLAGPVAGLVLWHWHPGQADPSDLAWSSALTFASAAFMLVSQPPRAVLEAHQRFFVANLIRGPAAAAIFLAPLAAFAFHVSLTSAAIAILATRIIAAGGYFLACRGVGAAQPAPAEVLPAQELPALRRAFLHKAIWLGLTNIFSMLLAYVDRFVLAALASAAAVGRYAIAQEVVTKLWIASGAAISAGTPRLASHRGEADTQALQVTARQLIRVMWVLGVAPAAVLIAFGEPLLRLWLRGSFDPGSVLPLQVMALGVGVNNLTQVNFALLQVHGGERRGAWLQVFHLAFMAAALALLVPRYGVPGAAFAFSARLLADAMLVRWLLRGTSPEAARAGVGMPAQLACAAGLTALLLATRW
ncbi:oligosaccharide flippase family protein [Ramlibacter sp. G-1-2-2]|uniref:Oligosaccharide flippase family protein n=1 Tax=Ramlibacter agri TaxID=2728837 RepID=A0A848HGY9_9BURK|nr:oligosaccharide flippase family protein [Ramlibacter agri]NML47793.1 oligosaccharide flippase family protein [Ramlibacter agri]